MRECDVTFLIFVLVGSLPKKASALSQSLARKDFQSSSWNVSNAQEPCHFLQHILDQFPDRHEYLCFSGPLQDDA
jgi:hypothetical protein